MVTGHIRRAALKGIPAREPEERDDLEDVDFGTAENAPNFERLVKR